ncbi:MAG: NAD(P) transhydrogenase subunit alpha [Myxococcota bacterium]|jgi:NAD(P) transhydrogenase subunit alpha|nr:NAD(P) transhydrogenase subunit alpha [Myxococcota bacterium]
MSDLLLLLAVLLGSLGLGWFAISRVPPRLHTPLMSLTNALSAVTLLGALALFGTELSTPAAVLCAVAVLLATFNLVGGFAITDRMLAMFRGGKRS